MSSIISTSFTRLKLVAEVPSHQDHRYKSGNHSKSERVNRITVEVVEGNAARVVGGDPDTDLAVIMVRAARILDAPARLCSAGGRPVVEVTRGAAELNLLLQRPVDVLARRRNSNRFTGWANELRS